MPRTQSVGDGRNCLTHPMHGPSFRLRSGTEWCAHQSHDGAPARDGKAALPSTPAFLHKQEAEQKASA
jgi:hypothetical protein